MFTEFIFSGRLAVIFFIIISLDILGYEAFAQVFDLRCVGQSNPGGIDRQALSFSWKLKCAKNGCSQLAYQILVASSKEKLNRMESDVWNSGKRVSNQSIWIKYEGKELVSSQIYHWKVVVWPDRGQESMESEVANFSTGLLSPGDWTASWIGLDSAFSWDSPTRFHSRLSARYFRKTFTIKREIKRATLYVVGLGLYELYVNGAKVGDQVLAPTVSDYSKRVYYNTYDLTGHLAHKNNTIGIVLGNGRFFSLRPGEVGEWKEEIPTITNFGFPKLLFQLHIEYKNGSAETVISDNTWKVTADGPIRSNNEYDGETYDARKEMPNWHSPDFDDSAWLPVSMTSPPDGKVCWQPNPNMQIMQELKPIAIQQLKKIFVIDMGQNMAGWVSINTEGKAREGDTITLRFAERLNEDGRLYMANLRHAEVTDRYVVNGGSKNKIWEPSFVYHGFRYVSVEGVDSLQASDITGKVIYDDMETTGSFTSSHPLLNQIHKNARWGISGNYKGMPVDCPQRDERMGWLGDRSINSFGESFIFDNYLLYVKWLDDIKDSQLESGSIPDVAPSYWWRFFSDNMTWPSTYLFVSDMIYRQFGDQEIIRRHYPAMKKWMLYMQRYLSDEHLLTKDSYGDWCMPPESLELIHSKDSTRKTPGEFIASAYFYHCLKMMEEFAVLSNQEQDQLEYRTMADNVLVAINKKYLNESRVYYANNTTTANLLALAFELAPVEARDSIMKNIVTVIKSKYDNHLSTGLIGNQWLMRGLSNNGFDDLAFAIASNTTYPSWGYMIKNGATTFWELWNGNTANPAMNSGNHVMLLGDLLLWYYENLAGIKSIEPGFKKIEMKPSIGSLIYVSASHRSPYGVIESNWTKSKYKFHWTIVIPANSSAIVYIPSSSKNKIEENMKPLDGNKRIKFIENKKGYFVFEVQSGEYHFVVGE